MAGTDLEAQNPAASVARVRELFTDEDRETIAKFLKVAPDEPALMGYLAICAQWGLDPVAGQIYLIPQKGKNGQPGGLKPAASRDGYMAIANRQPDFIGCFGDVVHANDTFKVSWEFNSAEGWMEPKITHSYEQGPGVSEDAEMRMYRGPVLGAWALVTRKGRAPQYYFAPLSEHGKDPDKSAWSYRSAMILKSAYSMALRLAYSITGLTPVDELRDATGDGVAATEEDAGGTLEEVIEGEAVLNEDEELRERLVAAIERANKAEPYAWTGSKLQMMLSGRDAEGIVALVAQIEDEAQAAEEAAEQIVDAEVVEDDDAEKAKADAASEEAEKPEPTPEQQEQIEALQSQHADLTASLGESDDLTEQQRSDGEAELQHIAEKLAELNAAPKS